MYKYNVTKGKTLTKADWIRNKLKAGVTKDQLYMMYKSFVREAGEGTSFDTYKRKVRQYSKTVKKDISDPTVKLKTEVEGANTTIVSESHEIRTLDQLLAYTRTDLDKYYVSKSVVNSWGSADNPSFQVKAWLSLKEEEPETDEERLLDLIKQAKSYAPKYPTIKYNKMTSGNALEVSLFDHHFGQLSWGLETGGKNYDIKISKEMALDAVSDILSHAQYYKPEKIIIPIGNDFFNVNDQTNTTQHGTPQAEDERWQKTYVSGRTVWASLLEMCQSVAKTKAIWIPGNHDPERSFHLCDSLYCWFHNSQVEIDHSPNPKKVEVWGKTACLYTHGCNERKNDLPTVFATSFPKEFSEAKYRAMHLGHLHHTDKSSLTVAEDVYSVDVKIKPTLVPLNAWSAGKAYKAIARTEAEVWNKEDGLIADLYYNA